MMPESSEQPVLDDKIITKQRKLFKKGDKMKKTIRFLFLMLLLSAALFSCEFIESQHNHKYSKTWTTTEEEHWRSASCEHTDLIVNKGVHEFDDGVVTKSPTEEEDGIKTFTCTTCKFSKTELISRLPHTHKYDTEHWAYNDSYHWHEPTCGHMGAAELSPHSMNGNDCWDCDYMAESQGLTYRLLSDGTYEVSSRGSCTDSNVVIPAKYNGIAVTSIGESAFAGELNITTKVVIPSSVTTIKAAAFYYAQGLKEVIFKGESSLTTIGSYAFYKCDSALKSFTIPKTVTSIGEGAFHNCVLIEEFIVEEGNTAYKAVDGNLFSIDGTKLLQYATANPRTEYTVPTEVTTLGIGVFAFSTHLEKIYFSPESTITAIPAETFNFSTNITEIVLPTGVTSIGNQAFFRCLKLTSINIPEGLKTIGNSAFEHCDILPDIELPNTVTKIGERAFAYCDAFTRFDLPPLVTYLSTEILTGCASLTEVTIPATVTNYGTNMFYGASSLASVTVDPMNMVLQSIDGHLYTKNGKTFLYYSVANTATDFSLPSGVTKIIDSAFYACGNLVNVTLPGTLKTIGKNAFMLCSKLESINLPEGLSTVGAAAFRGCESLKEITFPSTLKVISNDMIFGCNQLKNIVIPATVTEIQRDAFAYIPLETLVFENTEVWTCYITTDRGESSVVLSAEDLANNEKAIEYITRVYQGYTWKWTQP